MKKEAKERGTAEAQAEQMKALRLDFERKVGEHGMLYGSVTSMHIAEALKERGYEIDRRRIHLPEAIKETGEHTVSVRLHRDVTIEIPVTVNGEGGAQAPTTTEAAAGAESAGAEATRRRRRRVYGRDRRSAGSLENLRGDGARQSDYCRAPCLVV